MLGNRGGALRMGGFAAEQAHTYASMHECKRASHTRHHVRTPMRTCSRFRAHKHTDAAHGSSSLSVALR